MPHDFDTSAATSGRTLLRNAIVAQLEQLTVAEGLYLAAVVPLPVPFVDDPTFEYLMLEVVGTRSPVVAIALGDGKINSGGAGYSDEWTEEIEVYAYVISTQAALPMQRMTGDALSLTSITKDPGVETILEHVRERLAGFRPSATGLTTEDLRPTRSEPGFYFDPELTMARLSFAIKTRADVNRLRGFTQLLEGVDATHGEDDADPGADRPTLSTETDIDP